MTLNSSPHGAGRVFSRSAARKQLTREDLRASMVGIKYKDSDAFIDEIPAAYKDIAQADRQREGGLARQASPGFAPGTCASPRGDAHAPF